MLCTGGRIGVESGIGTGVSREADTAVPQPTMLQVEAEDTGVVGRGLLHLERGGGIERLCAGFLYSFCVYNSGLSSPKQRTYAAPPSVAGALCTVYTRAESSPPPSPPVLFTLSTIREAREAK